MTVGDDGHAEPVTAPAAGRPAACYAALVVLGDKEEDITDALMGAAAAHDMDVRRVWWLPPSDAHGGLIGLQGPARRWPGTS
jgi:hypothetical protein